MAIVEFKEIYSKDFQKLNEEWLVKDFVIEPYDKKLLENCKEFIIDKGGHIFFYKFENKIIGTVALLYLNKGVYEISKMAVSTAYRGKGFGKEMLKFIIEFSKKNKYTELLIYSSRILNTAINLYRKMGFKEISLEKNTPYKRADIKMIMKF